MSEYIASTIIKILQAEFATGQEEAGRLLLEPVATQDIASVDVTSKMVTNLVKRSADVHSAIKRAAVTPEVVPAAQTYITESILNKYTAVAVNSACAALLNLMKGDKSVPDAICTDLESLYQARDYLQFLTSALLLGNSRVNTIPDAVVRDDDFYFVEEAQYKCPLCGDMLWKKVKGKIVNKYRIVQIYPEGLDIELDREFSAVQPAPRSLSSVENKTALCLDCSEAYMIEPTVEDYTNLCDRKKAIARVYQGKIAAAASDIETEIADIIKAITGIDRTTELKPFTDVLTLDDKILPENQVLHNSIEDDVTRYYPYIETQFSLLDGVGGNSFNMIRSEITACYEKLENAQMNQEEICNELSNWILEKSGFGEKYKTAGNIVVSFFVQNCSVFKNIHVEVPTETEIQVQA